MTNTERIRLKKFLADNMRVYTVQGGSVTNVSGTVLISTVQQLPFIEVPEGYEDSAEVKELLVNKMFQELLEIF